MMPDTQAEIATDRRPDVDILADVRDGLWRDDQIRTLEQDSYQVAVSAGIVALCGHVTSTFNREAAEEIAANVPGVSAVNNRLVADSDLSVAISRALAADPRTEAVTVTVKVFRGWVSLIGEVGTAEEQAASETVAVAVPGVRGVLDLPDVRGQAPSPIRRALQPLPGSAVYASDGWAGRVTGVVIDADTRLVSHLLVAARLDLNGREWSGQVAVPVEMVRSATASGVFLDETYTQLAARPPYLDEDFPSPPADWAPPFPYSSGVVRWARNP
jgi:osmotically-inducible protein OsmY